MKNITIITGGSRGVGKQLAKEFLLKGENVAIISRTKSELEKTREELSKLTTNDVVAYVGSVRDEVLEFVSLAEDLLKLLKEKYPQNIEKRYPNCQIVLDIAKLRKFVLAGGQVDLERAYYMPVDDFRKGRLGKMTLD